MVDNYYKPSKVLHEKFQAATNKLLSELLGVDINYENRKYHAYLHNVAYLGSFNDNIANLIITSHNRDINVEELKKENKK